MDEIDLRRAIRRKQFTELVTVEHSDVHDAAGMFILRIGSLTAQGHVEDLVQCINRTTPADAAALCRNLGKAGLLS